MDIGETVESLRTGPGDSFESVGTAAGVFLIVVSLARLLSMPWATNNDLLVSFVQLLGIAGSIAVGAGLIKLAREGY